MTSHPQILFAVVATHDLPLIEAHLHLPIARSSKKYVKASRKILKRISRGELRRPDGMATLLSGSYAYNYVHGCDIVQTESYLESLVFLCVTEALPYAATPTETREAAFNFLGKNRSVFLQQFSGDLQVLCKATQSTENGSSESSSLVAIDENMRSYLNRFSASMRDQMTSYALDEYETNTSAYSASDSNIPFPNNNNKNNLDTQMAVAPTNSNSNSNSNPNPNPNSNRNSVYRHDDEKDFTDLRQSAPSSLPPFQQHMSNSGVDQVMDALEGLKANANRNIEMIIDRGEDVALLQEKSDRLATQSHYFHSSSRQLRFHQCQQLYKQRCIIAIVVIFVLYLLSAMVCGWSWHYCGR